MEIVVQKYGGKSLADPEKINNVAYRIAKAKKDNQVVVVVSAMGDTTDELIALVHQISQQPDKRELDSLLATGEIVSSTLLVSALQSLGQDAISLTGAQAGIKTDNNYGRARIVSIDPSRILEELKSGRIVVIAGFQGVTEKGDVATLGRGGSDTSAVALAAKLGAKRCEIYTDVKGIFTADPRLVPEARQLEQIDYEETLELASLGAKVIHPRAVELGELFNLPILVASSFADAPGTLIQGGIPMEIRSKVRNIVDDSNLAKITIIGVPDQPCVASAIFRPLAQANISVDTIVQNASIDRITDLTFTVARSDLVKAMSIVEPVAKSIGAKDCVSDSKLAKVSVVGTGMRNSPGYAADMFEALSGAGINIELISTSEIRITCIVNEDRIEEAVRVLHRAFELEKIEE